MTIDYLEPRELYGDLNITIKQSIDMVKEDTGFHRIPGKAVRSKFKGPLPLQSIKGLAAVLLVLFLSDFLISRHWNLLAGTSGLRSLIVALIALTVVVSIQYVQYVLFKD